MVGSIQILIIFIVLCLLPGALGAMFTSSSIPIWYASLNKPDFFPPNFIFGPVWTALYIFMGVSLYLVWKKKNPKEGSFKLNIPIIFWVQLLLNLLWSIIFFGLKNPSAALIEIAILWAAILLTIKTFYPISKISAYLLIPYLIWVGFATILNLSIVLLN